MRAAGCTVPVSHITHHTSHVTSHKSHVTHHLELVLPGIPAEGPHDLLELLRPDGAAAVTVEEGEDLAVLGQLLRGQLLDGLRSG